MKFPFWLLPIILSTIFIVAMSENKKEDDMSKSEKRRKNIVLIGIGIIGFILTLAIFLFL